MANNQCYSTTRTKEGEQKETRPDRSGNNTSEFSDSANYNLSFERRYDL